MVSKEDTLRQEIYLWKVFEVMGWMLLQQDEVAKVVHYCLAPETFKSTEGIAHILIYGLSDSLLNSMRQFLLCEDRQNLYPHML